MSVGDVRSEARGSGARFNTGKHPIRFTPLHLLEDVNRVWEYGANKYAAWNWAKGMDWVIPYECMMRHMAAWYRGEEIDPESGQTHLGHAMANLLMLVHYRDAFPEGDTRPAKYFAKGGVHERGPQSAARGDLSGAAPHREEAGSPEPGTLPDGEGGPSP